MALEKEIIKKCVDTSVGVWTLDNNKRPAKGLSIQLKK